MADISLVQDCSPEEADEGVYDQSDNSTIGDPRDDGLTPAERIGKYAYSDTVYHRQLVSKVLEELFKFAPADALTEDLNEIMEIVVMLAEENGIMVRTHILEKIPKIASLANDCSLRVPALASIVSEYLLPLVVRNVGTGENQVRKTAHTTLYMLMDMQLVSRAQAEIQVCPTILALSRMDCMYHTDAISLMSKLISLLGRDVTERVFLDRFTEMCTNNKYHVRQVCASYFGEFCAVVSKETYEKILLPTYTKLCVDDIWGVRKACADVILPVSCVCTPEARRTILAPVFAKLLEDDIRWVRISAFQSLGPFISTFAVPSVTSLSYNTDGDLVLVNNDGSEFKASSSTVIAGEGKDVLYSYFYGFNSTVDVDLDFLRWDSGESQSPSSMKENGEPTTSDDAVEKMAKMMGVFPELMDSGIKPPVREVEIEAPPPAPEAGDKKENANSASDSCTETPVSKSNNDCDVHKKDDVVDDDVFEKPLVKDMPLDPSIVDAGRSPQKTLTNVETVEKKHTVIDIESPNESEELHNPPDETFIVEVGAGGDIDNPEEEEEEEEEPPKPVEPLQDIVPQVLLDHFISMTNPYLAILTNNNIAYHCAYSLPAVALTLSSKNWHLLKDTVETLAGNMQYKVRRTLASSLHELAIILGPDMASDNLTPIFNGFIKDLDEVRIGVLKHLAHFLSLINPSMRAFYLPRLQSFLDNNHEMNWRFRHELAEQLLLAVSLFPPAKASKYISSIAQKLLGDKVAMVRLAAQKLVAELVRHVSSELSNDPGLTSHLLIKFAELFAHSQKWKFRQTFVLLGADLLETNALDLDLFASDVMPHLLDLSWDPVANVRLVVAQTIARHMINHDYFVNPENQCYDSLELALRRLQTDKDRDVRLAAQLDPVTTTKLQSQ